MAAEVTGARKLENDLVILGTFKAITKNPAIACKVSRGAYEHEALMHSRFPLGNPKDQCDFNGLFKEYSYCYVIFICHIQVPYTYIARHSVP